MSKTIQEQLQELRQEEQEKFILAQENGEEYTMKDFEILDEELREVLPNEWDLVRANPLDFPESVQKKYFWDWYSTWNFPESVSPDDEVPEGFFLISYRKINPYTWEERTIFEHRIIQTPVRNNQQIGEVINREVYEWNPYAQIAELTKSQIINLRLLVPIIGKENIQNEYAELIENLRKISDARVLEWIDPFDLSFLD